MLAPLTVSNDVPDFDSAVKSLSTYRTVDRIPRAVFRRLNALAALEGLSVQAASELIAQRIGFSRDVIRKNLLDFPAIRPIVKANKIEE